MGISKEEAIKELQTRETVFVAYSQATKLPFVKCDEETFNDQAWIFSTEEGIKEFGKKMVEDKILLMGMRFSKKDYPRLYGTFYAIGVNTVVWDCPVSILCRNFDARLKKISTEISVNWKKN